MSATQTIADLQTAYNAAAREAERLAALAAAAELASTSPAVLAQAKADAARITADDAFQTLSRAQEAEARAVRQSEADAAYRAKLAEVERCHTLLLAQQKQQAELVDAIAFGGRLHTRLLQELDVLKKAAESLAA